MRIVFATFSTVLANIGIFPIHRRSEDSRAGAVTAGTHPRPGLEVVVTRAGCAGGCGTSAAGVGSRSYESGVRRRVRD
eukprot:1193423-Prorocentrum_minimum.AAC.2